MRTEANTARDLALAVLRRVFAQGAFASSALRAAFDSSNVSAADRALATELVYGVLRRRGHLDRALSRASGRRLKDLDPKLHDVLRLVAYQLMFLDRIPAHAAVDEAVEQARARGGEKAAAQTNAISRKLAATPPLERIPPPADARREPSVHLAHVASLPEPLAALLISDLGREAALAFGLASLEEAPPTLRANALVTTAERIAQEVGGTVGHHRHAVHLPSGSGLLPAELACVKEGRATPQDEASMHVVDLLEPRTGEKILDLCAAPGGKTTYIAESMGDEGEVVAHDRLPDRLARVREQASRLHLKCVRTTEVVPGAVESFDRVLVDAPCSGLGTLRRHPEIRWRFSVATIEGLAAAQRALLAEAAPLVRPGGVLVYSVCTVTKAEGETVLSSLGPEFRIDEILRTSPADEGAPDGFFAARLVKSA